MAKKKVARRSSRRTSLGLFFTTVGITGALLTACGAPNDPSTPTPTNSDHTSTPDVQGTSAFGVASFVASTVAKTPEGLSPTEIGLGNMPTPAQQIPVLPTSQPSQFDLDDDGFYTYQELVPAISALYPAYVWPAQYQITLDDLIQQFAPDPDAPVQWERGMEYLALGGVHLCAWSLELRQAMRDEDASSIAESLDQLRLVAIPNPQFIYTHDYIQDAVDQASLGDPGPLQFIIDIENCESLVWRTQSATPNT